MGDVAEALRASGKTAAQEKIDDLNEDAYEPTSIELPDERERQFRFPGFSRMRTDWYGSDRLMMAQVHATAEEFIDTRFRSLLKVRAELYDVVREAELDVHGEPRLDEFGWSVWKRDEEGDFIEDWGLLTNKQRERFLFLITARMFDWEESRDRIWSDSMMAKVQWEEAFSTGWQECTRGKGTEGDRTAAGRLTSQEERYFAIFEAYLSRRADSLVRGMERLAQRVKDVHTA